MQPRAKQWLANSAMAIGSLALSLLVLEYLVFGWILKPDDLLPNVSKRGVVRYQPGTQAVFRQADGTTTTIRINADGWNSSKPAYSIAKAPGRLRIAVIGDSYVHGSFVNTDQGFPEVLERALIGAGRDAEVYRFGMDGAPLSQYLHMLRSEVISYRPDIVVIQLIHNDFDESYRFLKTRYSSSFLKLTAAPDGRVTEIQPANFEPGFSETLRRYNTFRYLYYETNLYLKARGLVSRAYWGGAEDFAPEFISSGVDVRKIGDSDKNRFFARYVLAEMQALAGAHGFKLAFAMDAVRDAIYGGRAPESYEVGRLNGLAHELTAELGLPFLDLQSTFAAHYASHRQRFEFAYDWHWNVLGNHLAGDAIAGMLLSDPRLLGKPPRVGEGT